MLNSHEFSMFILHISVMDRPVLPRPYVGDHRGRTKEGVVDTQVRSKTGVRKVPTGCPLWGKGVTVLEGGRVLARGTGSCT